ncbi:hypothetical protein EBZ38_07110 [bacterium]|nr:hypothetical protein [bacterium]
MGNPNPFYRFNQGWNAGFYPDNQIMTDLINEMVGQLIVDLPSIWPNKTIDALYYAIKQWVKVYEEKPYYGIFDFTIQKITDIPNNEYNINVFNPDMATLNISGAGFTVNGFYNPTTNLVVNSNVQAFTPGSFTGTFAEPLIAEEIKVKNALDIVNINGSAIFPITYSFNPISNVATSGLSRGDNWFLNGNGVPDRQPVPNRPYQNRRTFELPALNGDDNYIISVMERIIQASLNNPALIVTEYNKYTMPDGWTKSIANPGYTTYNRYQIDFVNANRRKFILVGRYDGGWLWQRFVSDEYGNSPYNFLSAYSENTALSYEPLQAGRWIYNDDTFDFEFVDFVPACYESPEFYAMPAKPGDQYQFNVVDANLTGLSSVNVGLFEQDGQFIQKIGEASIPVIVITELGMYGYNNVRFTYTDWYDTYYTPEYTVNFQMTDCDGNVIGDVLASIPVSGLTTSDFSEFKSVVEGLAWPDYLSVVVELDDDGKVIFTYTLTSTPVCFCSITAWTYYEGSGETVYFIKPEIYEQTVSPIQFQANCTIPAVKDGCYRFGLYSDPDETPPGEPCEFTFNLLMVNPGATLNNNNENYEGHYFGWSIYDGVNHSNIYLCPDVIPLTPISLIQTLVDFANTIPGMTATWNETDLEFTWTTNVSCGGTYQLWFGVFSEVQNPLNLIGNSEQQTCSCEPGGDNTYYLYSFSNIINIDRADCFSTMLEFWSDDNTMAEGFEYFNNWKQRIRIGLNGGGEKPVIEESLYRQSNGVHRRPQNKQDLSIDLHTDFFDLETQLAMTDATRHPYIVWNNQGIFVKGDIDVATIQDFTTQTSFETLSQMKFQALKQGFQPRNSSCLTC